METTKRGLLREQAAAELRATLARRRISAAQLARRLGWAQSYMARRWDGRVALDLDDLEAIAAELDVPVTDLLPQSVKGPRLTVTNHPRADRPPNNRPNGRPRKKVENDSLRRPKRTRPAPGMVPTRSAA